MSNASAQRARDMPLLSGSIASLGSCAVQQIAAYQDKGTGAKGGKPQVVCGVGEGSSTTNALETRHSPINPPDALFDIDNAKHRGASSRHVCAAGTGEATYVRVAPDQVEASKT